MKKKIIFSGLLAVLMLVISVYGASGSWLIETVDSVGRVGWYTSLALDSSNKVHISYYGSDGLKYVTNVSGQWQTEVVDNVQLDFATSLELDPSGYAHISYYDMQSIRYATNTSGQWVTETVDSAGSACGWSSLALDSSDHVHISYSALGNSSLKYATNASGQWATETVDSTGNVGGFNSLAVDSSGYIHISYFDLTNEDLKYAVRFPILRVLKSAPDYARTGNDLTYAIAYDNSGTDATGVTITDAVPTGATFVSATDGGVESNGTVTWNIGNLSAGASGQVSFTVSVSDALDTGNTLTNVSYSIDSDQTEPVSGGPVSTSLFSCGLKGDVDESGSVDVLDVIRVLKIALGLG